ncbi:uncharacterized protein LOC126807716 [Patella vulgata]|uniref:uncharacterized protein LOC126807716 n=1 Tax=Patella vulgata TaxID=6465 RepID=UPI002180831F|nr:uncharacterized protein LOC126807716 [Patella vulgata]
MTTWPTGTYSLLKPVSGCPAGFKEGSITIHGVRTGFLESFVQFGESTPPITAGVLPDGTYDPYTRFRFCCRSDGYSDVPIRLPNTDPFVLFKYQGECQQVEG